MQLRDGWDEGRKIDKRIKDIKDENKFWRAV
jgi:hypothetical protein